MPGTGKPIASNTAVVPLLITGLPKAGKSNDHITGLYLFIGHQPVFWPARRHGAVYCNGANYIPNICRFSSQKGNVNSMFAHIVKEFLRAFNKGAQYFTGNQVLVAVNGGRKKQLIGNA